MADDIPQVTLPDVDVIAGEPPPPIEPPLDLPDTPLETATTARLEGYTWPEIDGHIAQARQLADQFGYSQQQVDDHLGYRDPSPLLDKLSLDATDRMREQTPDADPLDLAGGGLIKRTRDGLVAGQVSATLRQDYASALTDGQVKSPQDFAEATTDAIGRAAGVDASPAARGIAAQLPDPRDATDYAIGVADLTRPEADPMKPPPAEQVNDTRTNMLNAWAETGQDFNTMYRAAHADPLFQDALTSPTPEPPNPRQPGNVKQEMDRPQPTDEQREKLNRDAIQPFFFVPGEELPYAKGIREAALDAATDAAVYTGTALAGKYIVAPLLRAGADLASPYVKELGEAVRGTLKDTSGAGEVPMLSEARADFNSAVDKIGNARAEKPVELPVPTDWAGKRGPLGFSNLEDELNRLRGNDTATKRDLLTTFKAIPDEWRTDSFQAKVGTSVEQRMVDPAWEHAPDVQQFLDAVKPLTDKQYALAKEIDTKTNGAAADYDPTLHIRSVDEGYVHRITEEANPLALAGAEKENPITGLTGRPRSMSTFASGMQRRAEEFSVFDHGEGVRTWNPAPDQFKMGQTYEKPEGGTVTVKPATMAEIEEATARNGNPIKYENNFIINTMENVARLDRINHTLDFLATAGKEMENAGLFVRDVPGKLNPAPANFIPVNGGINFTGRADPKVAYALNDFFRGPENNLVSALRRASQIEVRSLFLSPFGHDLNMTMQWFNNRGADWIKPWQYGPMIRNMVEASREIANSGPRWLQSVREGSSDPYMSMQVQNFAQILHTSMLHDIAADPEPWNQIIKKFALKPYDVYSAMLNHSQSGMWWYGQVLKLGRQFELEEKGLAPREAIFQAEKDMNNYRVPTTAMGSPLVHEFFTGGWSLFGRYHFGLLRSQALMINELMRGVGSDTGTRTEALGKAIAMAFGTFVALPLAAYGVSKGVTAGARQFKPDTPDINLSFGYHGAASLYAHAAQMAGFTAGQNQWWNGVSGLLSLNPIMVQALEAGANKDIRTGEPIVNPKSSTPGKVGEVADFAAKQLPIIDWATTILKPGGIGKVLGSMVALNPQHQGETPGGIVGRTLGEQPITTPAPTKGQLFYQRLQQSQANSAERRGQFSSWLDDLFGTSPPPPGSGGGYIHSRGRR